MFETTPSALFALCVSFSAAASGCASSPAPATGTAGGSADSAVARAVVERPLTFERIAADPPLEGRAPTALALSPDGAFLTWLQPNEEDSEVLDLTSLCVSRTVWGMETHAT